jgi:exodeoxyribonuclease VII small subunit
MPTAKSARSLESSVTTESQPQSFEAALERLGTVVERLESGELGLEESLRLFEEGVRLARAAQERLDSAEKRVEELVQPRDEEGNPVSRELEPE